ncbi:MAG: right-handed parallel beta-helix repeat-containing protein [Akkermansiaceae bacterium]|nr:right-handed parallel beta-helix repeat-containing protein [Akkermansiaceae bacterium]MCP5546925.1 right-handed parallel beta-helix repeat-containing protein [Akkermansiaceae bacterium]
MRQSIRFRSFHLFTWVAAASILAVTGCGEDKEKPLVAEGPAKVERADRHEDLRALIDAELAEGSKRIVIPQGRYRVRAQRGNHLVFQDLSDVEIVAENVELVCTATVGALKFERCSNVTLRGLTIDYDPLPFTQGAIVAMAPDKSWMDFEVAKGYPEDELEERIQIYDPETGELRRGDARWEPTIESLGEHRHRVRKSARYRFDPALDTEQVGDILVTNHNSGGPGSPHAITLHGCDGMRFEDITVYASPCFGFLEYDSNGSSYIRCIVDRRDPADDPVERSQARMRSLNADAFHSKFATTGPAIIGCTARFQGDDCVNINGKYHYVSGSRGRLVRIAVLEKEPKIKAGDPVEFLPYSGPRPPDAVVVDMQPDPTPVTGEEKAFIGKLRLDEKIRAGLLGGKARFYTLKLDRETALPAGSAVCCPLRVGNGFVVKDCDFGHNRSRGILIKASKGEVTGNRIINSRMAAIQISPEFWWMEAGISSDIAIRDNTFKDCPQTSVRVLALGGDHRPLPSGTHRNIAIVGNRFENCAWPLIHVTSTAGLSIAGNAMPESPPERPARSSRRPIRAILLENCEPVREDP